MSLYTEEGHMIEAHKVILSAYSTVFRKMLNTNSSLRPLLYMRGISMDILKGILDFIYTGKANVDESILHEFLKVADELNVSGFGELNETNNKEEQPLQLDKQKQLENNIQMEYDVSNKDMSEPTTNINVQKFLDMGTKFKKEMKVNTSPPETETRKLRSSNDSFVKKEYVEVLSVNPLTKPIYPVEEYEEIGSEETHQISGNEEREAVRIDINGTEVSLSSVQKSCENMYYKDEDSGIFQCKHCPRKTQKRNHMQEHVVCHNEGIVFTCLKCSKTVHSFSTMRAHMKKTHNFTFSAPLKRRNSY